MTVHVHFRHPFRGLLFSHAPNGRCVHVGPGTGVTSASFDIRYDSCGTREDAGGRFHENTLVVQFDPDILEAWDEAKRLRCEWLESFEKKSSYGPPIAIADLDVVELNFQGDDIDCWMEVQEGKGPWSKRVEGLVPVGSPLTLVIAIDDPSRQFDMRVKRCTASGNGNGRTELQLTDTRGCVSRPSLLTPFAKVREHGGGRATLVAYSHLHAFKFPDQMDVYVHCIVEVCRHGCAETCHGDTTHETLEPQRTETLSGLPWKPDNDVFPGRKKNRQSVVLLPQTQVRKSVVAEPRPSSNPASESPTPSGGTPQNVAASHQHDLIVDSKQWGTQIAHRIIGHDAHWIQDEGQPVSEPSSADHAGSTRKQTAGRERTDVDYAYHSKKPYVTKMQWTSSESLAPIPQPEPAAWNFEEVNPMHSPAAVHVPSNPVQESVLWTQSDLSELSEKGLRVLSLNHKMKSQPLIYRDIVHSYGNVALPQPVYVSVPSPAPLDGNKTANMMKMTTLLPSTYQTAHQHHHSTTVRHPRPREPHRYPYPVPQFSPHQRLMAGLVADRRTDHGERGPTLHNNSEAGSRRLQIGETAKLPKSETVDTTTSESKLSSVSSDASATVHSEAFSGYRSVVSGFVLPSSFLDPPTDPDSFLPVERRSSNRRRKRSSESVFEVRQVFRVVAPSDLAFEWSNVTSVVVRGRRRAEAVGGVCVSPAGIGASVGCVFAFTLLSAVASVVLYEHGCRLSRRTSRLQHFIAGGSLEALCRLTRPHLYPD